MEQSTASILELRAHPPPKAPFARAVLRPASRETSHQISPSEADDIIEDGEFLGILAEEQLKLLALHIKNNHL
jgi:hypothetical protein